MQLLSTSTLAHFKPEAKTEVITDASPVGLGAVSVQKQENSHYLPVCYANRALTDVEKRYSQIERESLAILFGIERFRMYHYGLRFVVRMDHKPLVTLFSPGSNPLPRIERWVTRLMAYDFKVVYQPGVLNSADYLSRSNPLPINPKNGSMVMNYVNHIVKQSLPKALNLKQVVAATENDKELMKISNYIRTSWPMSERKSDYFKVRQHFSSSHGIMLFEKRILIPRSIRFKVLTLAHKGHQGYVRVKQHL